MSESRPDHPSAVVIDVSPGGFSREVLERSSSVPVVVDFWAEWCGPCRLLGPVLERLAKESGGKFVLAKVNVDRDPEAAARYGIRSIPAVLGFRDGEVVDAFVGVQPESVIRKWIDRLLPSRAEELAAQARKQEAANPTAAAALYGEALAFQPDLPQAQIGLVRLDLAAGRLEDAAARIAELERRGFLESEAERLKAELTLKLQATDAGSVEAARSALAERPDDPELRFRLAEALAAHGQYADALPLLLELVERDRKGIGERARQTMVAIFRLLPPGSDLVAEYQRQLSLLL